MRSLLEKRAGVKWLTKRGGRQISISLVSVAELLVILRAQLRTVDTCLKGKVP